MSEAVAPSISREAFDARLARYHDLAMADVLEMIDYLRDEGDSVLVGGSLALGLGNRLSDLDVVIAGRETPASRVPLEHWLKSLRVDVWLRAQSDIDALFERAEAALASERPLQGSFGNVDEEQELKLLHRVAFGFHWDGPELVPSSREYKTIARDLMAREYLERMRESAYVAQVAAAVDDRRAAVVNARLAVEEALHALLARRGMPWTGDKWLQVRLARDVPELDRLYRRFAALPNDDEDYLQFVDVAVATAAELMDVDLATESLSEQVTWSAPRLTLVKLGDRHLLASLGEGAAWELGAEELAAWRALAASTPDERAAWSGAGLAPEQARLCLRLYEQGIATIAWSRAVAGNDLLNDLLGPGE
jgi:hypothetical protein